MRELDVWTVEDWPPDNGIRFDTYEDALCLAQEVARRIQTGMGAHYAAMPVSNWRKLPWQYNWTRVRLVWAWAGCPRCHATECWPATLMPCGKNPERDFIHYHHDVSGLHVAFAPFRRNRVLRTLMGKMVERFTAKGGMMPWATVREVTELAVDRDFVVRHAALFVRAVDPVLMIPRVARVLINFLPGAGDCDRSELVEARVESIRHFTIVEYKSDAEGREAALDLEVEY